MASANRMQAVRITCAASVCTLTVGALVAGVFVAAVEGAQLFSLLGTIDGWLNFMWVAIGSSLLPSTLGALVGAVVAIKVARTWTDPRPRSTWLRIGARYGAIAGASISLVYCMSWILLGGAVSADDWQFLAFMTSICAVAGGISGMLLGCYCHRDARRGQGAPQGAAGSAVR